MCKFGCSNPVLLAGIGPGQFLSEKGRPTSTSSVQSISAWQQRWEKMGHIWDFIWDNMGKSLWMLISMGNMNQSMWNYVNICEHMWTSSVNKSKSSNFSINSHPSFPLSLSMFWCFFFFRFGPWHVQRLSDSSGSSIPKFHFSSFLTLKGRWQRRVPAWFLENISKNTCVILSELRWSQVHNWHTMMASAEDDGSGWDKDFATFSLRAWPGEHSTNPKTWVVPWGFSDTRLPFWIQKLQDIPRKLGQNEPSE